MRMRQAVALIHAGAPRHGPVAHHGDAHLLERRRFTVATITSVLAGL